MNTVNKFYYNVETLIGDTLFSGFLNEEFFKTNIKTSSYVIHNHALTEIYIISSGFVVIIIDDTEYTISKNELVVIPAGKYHRVKTFSKDFERSVIRFDFTKSASSKKSCISKITETILDGTVKILSTNTEIIHRIKDIEKLFSVYLTNFILKKPNELFHHKTNISFGAFMCEFLSLQSALSAEDLIPPAYVDTIYLDNFFFLNKTTGATIEDLAFALNYSPSHTNRILKKTYNMTFKQKIIETRMKEACSYLKETSFSINKIALLAGYKSRNAFERVFTKHFGITPSKFRNTNIY